MSMVRVRFVQDRMGFRAGTECEVGLGVAKTLVATKGAEIIDDDSSANITKKNVESERSSSNSGGSEASTKTGGKRQRARRSAKPVDSGGD